jgi:hypothetical protein
MRPFFPDSTSFHSACPTLIINEQQRPNATIYDEEPFFAIPNTVSFTNDAILGIFLSGPSDNA